MKIVKPSENLYFSALVYASPKTGKTTSLLELPRPILIVDVEQGTSVFAGSKDLVGVDIVMLEDLTDMDKILEMDLKKYKTIAVDSLSELEHFYLTELGKKGKLDGVPELRHYQQADFKIADIVRRLRQIGKHTVFTAWEQYVDIVSPEGEKTTVVKPMLRKAEIICGLMNIVTHMEISKKDGVTRYFNFKGNNFLYCGDRIWNREYDVKLFKIEKEVRNERKK